MPRGPAPAWRKRMPVTVGGVAVAEAAEVDAWILESVNRAGGRHDANGAYATLYIRELNSREEAAAWRQALYRCAHFMDRRGIAPVSMKASPPRRKGTQWEIEFCAVNKTHARAHVIATYGTDRSKWPYDPRRRGGALCSARTAATPLRSRSAPRPLSPASP